MKLERINNTLNAAVNRGIATILMAGVHEGIRAMIDNEVPLHVVARVVLGPNLRRSTDWTLVQLRCSEQLYLNSLERYYNA